MQESHVDQFAKDLTAKLDEGEGNGTSPAPTFRPKVEAAIQELERENKLFALPADELHILLAFRLWKKSPDAATGVFHYKVPKLKRQPRQVFQEEL